jgi:DNA-binding Xre family transcriptional regulator
MNMHKNCPSWIASNVKERIHAKQIKIASIAITLYMSKSAVSKMLNGQNQTIINYLPKLATLLDCSIEDLLQENATEERISKNITPLALSSATAAHKKIVPNTTDKATLKDKLLTHLEMQYAKAQDDIKYWQAKYYRMKDRFTALEAKHPKKPSK